MTIIKSLERILNLDFGSDKKQLKARKTITITGPARVQMLQIPKSSKLFEYMRAILGHSSGIISSPFSHAMLKEANISFYKFEMFKNGIDLLVEMNKENWQLTGTSAARLAVITFSEDYPVMFALADSADKEIIASWALAPTLDTEINDDLRKQIGAELFRKTKKKKKEAIE